MLFKNKTGMKKAARFIKRRKVEMKRHGLISVAVTATSLFVVLLMTGVLYYKNDIRITDGNETTQAFTMLDNPDDILSEFGYEIGEFDRVEWSGFNDGTGCLSIRRGWGVEVEADGTSFIAGAVEGESARQILSESGVELGEYDIVLSNDEKITVIRGFAVNITADGETIVFASTGGTVGELLGNSDIVLNKDDLINHPLNTALYENMNIVVKRVTYRERADISLVDYDTVNYYSNLIAEGEEAVIEGQYGEVESVYKEKLIDGVVAESELLSSVLIKEPVSEIVTHGKALRTPYSKRDFAEINLQGGLPVDYLYVISGKATAYTARPGAWGASGLTLQIGTVAVDPAVIPYGSLLYIVSKDGKRVYGAAIAADTGEFPASGVLVDLFMGTHAENFDDACDWGKREVDVYVISEGLY